MPPKLTAIFLDRDRRLRNGWWIVIFIAFIAATRVVYKPLAAAMKDAGFAGAWLEPLPFLFTLVATSACLALRRESLSHVGFAMDGRWFRQAALGLALGAATALLVAALIAAAGGVSIELNPARDAGRALAGVYAMLCVALLEENLYRGFVFQRLVDGLGAWPAQLILGALFAWAHWGNPGMQAGTEVVAMLDVFLGAVMLGLAYLRTRSLALPIGLHLGWNAMLGNGLGFSVSGQPQAGWFTPVLQSNVEWLTGGTFGPEASVMSPVVSLIVIIVLWRWKGTAAAASTGGRPGGSVEGWEPAKP